MTDRTIERLSLWHLSKIRRRSTVAVMYLSLSTYVGVMILGKGVWWMLLALGAFVVSLTLQLYIINPLMKEMSNATLRDPDGDQLQVSNRIYHLAYSVLGFLFMLAVFYAMVASTFTSPHLPLPQTSLQFSSLVVSVVLLFASLPASLMIWKGPELQH